MSPPVVRAWSFPRRRWCRGESRSFFGGDNERYRAFGVTTAWNFKVRPARHVFDQPLTEGLARRLWLTRSLGKRDDEGFFRVTPLIHHFSLGSVQPAQSSGPIQNAPVGSDKLMSGQRGGNDHAVCRVTVQVTKGTGAQSNSAIDRNFD